MCCGSMAGEGGWRSRSHQTVAVIFILCSLVHSSTCLSWQELSNEEEQDKVVNEATMVEVRTGSILFNGKKLQSKSGSASASAEENARLLYAYSDQPDNTEVLEQPSLLEDSMSNEAAWQRLNPSLHCSQKTMKFTAIGSVADDLQLDMGTAGLLPLQQVPDSCGYSVQQNALGLVLEVSYDGCNVIQEDGNYTLPMTWLETPVELICAVSMISAASPTTTTSKSPEMPEKLPFPFRLQLMIRRKRHTNLPMNDPRSPYYAYWYYYYYLNMLSASTTPAPTTTTTTTTTTKPPKTTTKPPSMNPYFPYYYYYYYPYYQYYYPRPQKKPAKPTTTTAKPTTSKPSTTTTTTKPSTTKAPSKPAHPQYPYPSENSEVYYYPIIQHFYGKPHVMPTKPSGQTTPTTKPSTPTTKPGETDPTTKPLTTTTKPTTVSTTTTKPTTVSTTTTKPTTVSTATTTVSTAAATTTVSTTQTVQTTPSSLIYPGPMSPFVPYYQNPFQPYVQYKSKKAGKFPFDPKFMPRAAFKSGAEPRSRLHPGFNYWQPGPWFPESAGQDNPRFDWMDWKNFQPEEN